MLSTQKSFICQVFFESFSTKRVTEYTEIFKSVFFVSLYTTMSATS